MLTKHQADFLRNEVLPALRSGEYTQGHNRLRDGDAFCCLGVMVDRAVVTNAFPGLGIAWSESPVGGWVAVSDESRSTSILPSSFAFAIFGSRLLDHGPRCVPHGGHHIGLSHANDTGYDFEQIADALEAWLDRQEVNHDQPVAGAVPF